jgi:hypothetical protein
MNALRKMRLSFPFARTLIIPVVTTKTVWQAVGQAGTNETVLDTAAEQLENSP